MMFTSEYGAHRPIQHDQGFTRSHWMLPSGNYSLHIALAAIRATINTTMYYVPTLLAISMAITMQWYYTARIARWRRFVAFIKPLHATIGQALALILPNRTCQRRLFRTFHREKELQLTCWPIITIGV